MNREKKLSYVLLLSLFVSLCTSFAEPTHAIVPVIQNVLVWQSDSDVIVNVTVYHTPVLVAHRVNRIEVNVSGTNHIFDLVQTTETFTYPCNIGPVEGTPSAQVRACCIVDDYSAWSAPFQIPEFPTSFLLLTFILSAVFAMFASRKFKSRCS
ncbi:hypothetical protein HXY33_04225 [Candidatus Bathyarchaeota archaeon]|nr:hypothetical protein [Candidatus Bathyarchaeota archaeon]